MGPLHICRKARECRVCEERTRAQVARIRDRIGTAWGQGFDTAPMPPAWVTAGLAGPVGQRGPAPAGELWGRNPFDRYGR